MAGAQYAIETQSKLIPMNIPIYQVDAFTNQPMRGNPAAVCPLSEWLPDETMRKIAAENNLPATAFFVKRDAHYELRWFTPITEIALCGHATLATAYVIFNCLNLEDKIVDFISPRSGHLRVEKQNDILVLDFPKFSLNEIAMPAGLAEAVGKRPQRIWETQGHFAMLLFENEEDIKSIRPDMGALSQIPYEIIITAKGVDSDFVSRVFGPRIGNPEDPVSGSTHCSLIPYWAEQLGKEKLYARQLSNRRGELFCELSGNRVRIGGHAVLYLKGEIYV
jgi:PhzF family phenazine biosynthesis protein